MKNLLYAILMVQYLLFIGCSMGTTNSVSNSGIDKEVFREVKALEKLMIENISNQDLNSFSNQISKLFKEKSGSELEPFFKQMNEIIDDIEIGDIDNFYINNSGAGVVSTVFSELPNKSGYSISCKPMNKEAFISVLKINTQPYQYQMLNLYSRYTDGWKLDLIKVGQYSINDLNAFDLYQKAVSEFDEGFIMDAGNSIFLSSQIAKPAGDMLEYSMFDEMKEFYDKVIVELRSEYTFPIELDKLSSKPSIINISPKVTLDGFFPYVEYLSTIELKDSVDLRKENDEIHNMIGNIVKGLNKNKKYVLYQALNEIPDGVKGVNTHGFVKENKNED